MRNLRMLSPELRPASAREFPCIETIDLGVQFGELSVLERINLRIAEGEFVSLLGPSGCGKSTLLRVLAGLLHASTGEVRVQGLPVGAAATDDGRLGLVFQKPLLLPWRNTLQNVLLPKELEHGGNAVGTLDRNQARKMIGLVQLEGFETSYPSELSGGMQQRVAIARALMSNPGILLMDEPFGALDEITREALNEELLRIWQSHETRLSTLVMVTHSIPEAVQMSDRIFVLAPRPARLVEVVDIPLPRPRSPEEPELARITAHVRRLMRSITCVA